MARWILIDNYTGYIYGDSADLDGKIANCDDPVEFARALDAHIGGDERDYEFCRIAPRDTSNGYHVFRADINGSEAVMVVTDGQSREQIEAVLRDCREEGYIKITPPQSGDFPRAAWENENL